MIKQPFVSVLMPIYNASAYLREALESVLQQTFTNFELLVMDDGSTDNSIEIVNSFHDQRIRLIKNTHNFIATLNKGIDVAAGKYVARMDADDVMLPHRLETQFKFMESHPEIDICGSYAESFGIKQNVMQSATEHKKIIASLLLNNSIIHPTIMLRRSIFENNAALRYPEGYLCAEDYKLWTVLAANGLHFATIPEVLLRYRRSLTQVTERNFDDMFESSLRIRMEYAQLVMEQIVEKENRYFDLFEQLIDLSNEGLINQISLTHIVYQVYINFLKDIPVHLSK